MGKVFLLTADGPFSAFCWQSITQNYWKASGTKQWSEELLEKNIFCLEKIQIEKRDFWSISLFLISLFLKNQIAFHQYILQSIHRLLETPPRSLRSTHLSTGKQLQFPTDVKRHLSFISPGCCIRSQKHIQVPHPPLSHPLCSSGAPAEIDHVPCIRAQSRRAFNSSVWIILLK